MKYRKKSVVIDAIRFTGRNHDEVVDFCAPTSVEITGCCALGIPTLEDGMIAMKGDWIVKDVNGETYPVKPDIFNATYEPV